MSMQHDCDVLVIGTGAAGFAAALTARHQGLDVLLVEKSHCFGGTTATSGGYVWIPGNSSARAEGIEDSPDAQLTYLRTVIGEHFDAAMAQAYLAHGPQMLDLFTRELGVEFALQPMPDYQPHQPGGVWRGRSLQAVPVNARILGPEFRRLRPPLKDMTLFGLSIGSGNNLADLYAFGRKLAPTLRVLGRFARYGVQRLVHGRGTDLVAGNALIARMAAAGFRLGVPLWTSAPASELLMNGDRVTGAIVNRLGQPVHVRARRGVVLASGGIAHDVPRRQALYRHAAGAEDHLSLTAPGNLGDGLRLAEQAGGRLDGNVFSPGAWQPVSRVPHPDGSSGLVFHSVNLGKPGVIAVDRQGRRFVDESVSYHDFVQRMIEAPGIGRPTGAYIVCDDAAFGKYGLGYAKPWLPKRWLRESGYLLQAPTIEALAVQMGIDPATLASTVAGYNEHARFGQDPVFGKGANPYGHYLGDRTHPINPNVAPLLKPPFRTVWMRAGDIGTFAGIRTDARARVLDADGQPIAGLYAAGNDMASVFGGHYPGGGSLIGPAMTFGYIAARDLAAMPGRGAHTQESHHVAH